MSHRRRTGYKDKNGKPIREGDTVGTWMSAPWDEEVPIFRTFKVEKKSGVGWMCKGEQSNDEDDLLKNFKHLEIQKAKPAKSSRNHALQNVRTNPMKLRIINGKTIKAQFQWEWRDLWVGLFWRVNREMPPPHYTLHLYICIVPLIPLHVTILKIARAHKPPQP